MADLTYTAANIRALERATALPGEVVAAASGNLGDWVYVDVNGKAAKSAGASSVAAGVVVAASGKKSSYAAGEAVTVIVFGPVTGFSGLSPGRLFYLSATTGKVADSGTVKMGYAVNATTVFVMPDVGSSAS